jgi:hypothetical protein
MFLFENALKQTDWVLTVLRISQCDTSPAITLNPDLSVGALLQYSQREMGDSERPGLQLRWYLLNADC